MKDELIIGYLNNELIPEEKSEVEEWIDSSEENNSYFNKIKYLWENSSKDTSLITIDTKAAWVNIQSAAMGEDISGKLSRRRFITVLTRIAAIAIILLAVGATIIYLSGNQRSVDTQWISIKASNEIQEVVLPDGSRVWLNSHSSLTYPDRFAGKSREVILTGEGFFEVDRNRRFPFVVKADRANVMVLGTSFNVHADSSSSRIVVTVVTGKVALFDTIVMDNRIVLQPEDQGILAASPPIILKRKNSNKNFLAWKTGILYFKNTPVEEVCTILSEHYNTTIRISDDDILKNKNLTATYDNKSIEEILNILALTLDISYRTENNVSTLFSE